MLRLELGAKRRTSTDPYANASLADSAAAIGRTADNAARNAVDGMTLGYGDKIASGLDALTGRSTI
jgi:hypothetical protein